MKALGLHVFAGGFSGGVKRVFDVECQLERHGFGLETAEQTWGVPTINGPKWPVKKADFIYGNPRCTGFSSVNYGCNSAAHGPSSEPTRDAWEFMEYALGKAPVCVWESVCQAYTGNGSPLIQEFVKLARQKRYRVAHVLVNARSFNCPQHRRRYFMVMYRKGLVFNTKPPLLQAYLPTTWTTIGRLRNNETHPVPPPSKEYTKDSWIRLTPDEQEVLPRLPTGYSLNRLGRDAQDLLPRKLLGTWWTRLSEMPFSRHGISRIPWNDKTPTLTSSCFHLIHPQHHRGLTIGELSAIMGWGDRIPVGKNAPAQLSKGVVPAVGEWIARQAFDCLTEAWDEDWSSSYTESGLEFSDSKGLQEKVCDLRLCVPQTVEPVHDSDALCFYRLAMDSGNSTPRVELAYATES